MFNQFGEITDRLKSLKRLIVIQTMIKLTLYFLFVFLGVLFLTGSISGLFRFETTIRSYLLFFLVIWGLVIEIGIIIYSCLRRQGDTSLSLLTEKFYPFLKNDLTNAVQFFKQEKQNYYSQSLIDELLQRTYRICQDLSFFKILSWHKIRRQILIFGIISAIFFGLVGLPLSPWKVPFHMLFHPQIPYPQISPFTISVFPGDSTLIKGRDLIIQVETHGIPPDSIHFFYTTEGEWRKEICQWQSDSTFHYLIKNLRQSIEYQVKGIHREQQVHGKIHKIEVQDIPEITELTQTIHFPEYTHLPEQELMNRGDLTALPGTLVRNKIRCNKNLSKARIYFSDSVQVGMKISGSSAQGSFTIKANREYWFALTDHWDMSDPQPIRYKIDVVEDEPPLTKIKVPGQDIDIDPSLQVGLQISIMDDYGFSKLLIEYRIERGGEVGAEKTVLVTLQSLPKLQDIQYDWDLRPLDLLPGDEVVYRSVVFDNNAVNGPSSGSSPRYKIRFPSIEEIAQEVKTSQEEQIQTLEEMMGQQKKLKEKIEDLKDQIKGTHSLQWEKDREIQAGLKKQMEMMETFHEVSKKLEENIDKIEKHQIAQQSITEKMQEVQKLLQDIATPELKEAMQKIQQMMEKVDPEKLKQALENFQVSQDQILKQLERTVALLKKIKAEQNLDTMIRRMDDLIQRQKKIESKTQHTSDAQQLEKLAQDQENAKEEWERLQQDLAPLQKELNPFAPDLADQMKSLIDSLNRQDPSKKMQQSAQSLRQKNSTASLTQQQQAIQAMQGAMDELMSMQSLLKMEEKKKSKEVLEKVVQQLLYISLKQEEIYQQTRQLSPDATVHQAISENQMSLFKATAHSANEIFKISMNTLMINPQVNRLLGDILRHMKNSLNELAERRLYNVPISQQASFGSLNLVILALLEQLDQMLSLPMTGGGMEQLLEQLQGMSEQQMMVNQMTLELLGQSLGEGLSLEERAQVERLAGQQAAIARELSRMSESARQQQDLLGDLGEMAKEAEEVTQALKNKQFNRDILKRQEKILSRLLDASKSIRKQEYSKERETGQLKPYSPHASPRAIPLDLGEKERFLREDLLKALAENPYPEYRELIKAYFNRLINEN